MYPQFAPNRTVVSKRTLNSQDNRSGWNWGYIISRWILLANREIYFNNLISSISLDCGTGIEVWQLEWLFTLISGSNYNLPPLVFSFRRYCVTHIIAICVYSQSWEQWDIRWRWDSHRWKFEGQPEPDNTSVSSRVVCTYLRTVIMEQPNP